MLVKIVLFPNQINPVSWFIGMKKTLILLLMKKLEMILQGKVIMGKYLPILVTKNIMF